MCFWKHQLHFLHPGEHFLPALFAMPLYTGGLPASHRTRWWCMARATPGEEMSSILLLVLKHWCQLICRKQERKGHHDIVTDWNILYSPQDVDDINNRGIEDILSNLILTIELHIIYCDCDADFGYTEILIKKWAIASCLQVVLEDLCHGKARISVMDISNFIVQYHMGCY